MKKKNMLDFLKELHELTRKNIEFLEKDLPFYAFPNPEKPFEYPEEIQKVKDVINSFNFEQKEHFCESEDKYIACYSFERNLYLRKIGWSNILEGFEELGQVEFCPFCGEKA